MKQNNYNFGKFFSRKFLILFIAFAASCFFLWFGKIKDYQAVYVWILCGLIYGFWNVLEDFLTSIKLSDIKDILSSINSIKETIEGLVNGKKDS